MKILYPIDFEEKEKVKCEEFENSIKNDPNYIEIKCSDCHKSFYQFRGNGKRYTLCCLCLKKKRILRFGSAVIVKESYPKITPLQTLEEIEEYFNTEKIVCLLCGNEYFKLDHHLKSIHGIDTRTYKLKFGLSLIRGLTGIISHEKLVDHGYKMLTKNTAAGIKMQDMIIKRGNHTEYSHSPALMKKRADSTKNAIHSPKHICNLKNEVIVFCSDCGAELPKKVTEMVAITHRCKMYCKKCKNKRHKISQEKWAENKGIDIKEFRRNNARNWLERKREKEKTRSI